MTSVSQWWNKQGNAARIDLYIRWSLYLISAAEPLVVLSIANENAPQARPTGLAVVLLVSVVHAGACIALLRAGMVSLLGGKRPAPWLIGIAAVMALALFAAGVASFPPLDALSKPPSMERLWVGILLALDRDRIVAPARIT